MTKRTVLSLASVALFAFAAMAVYAATDTSQVPANGACTGNAQCGGAEVCSQKCCDDCNGNCEDCSGCSGNCEECGDCDTPCKGRAGKCGSNAQCANANAEVCSQKCCDDCNGNCEDCIGCGGNCEKCDDCDTPCKGRAGKCGGSSCGN